MAQVDPLDMVYSDGKVYTFLAYLPPGANYQYKFSAQDTSGAVAGGDTSVTAGPLVSSQIVDLAIYASGIQFSGDTTQFDEGEVFTIYAEIENNSNVSKDNILVVIYEDEMVIDTLYIDHMDSWSLATVALDHCINQIGLYPIKVVVDPSNQIEEWNEFNNSAQRPVYIGDPSIPGAIIIENLLTSPVCPGGWVRASGHAQYYDPLGGPVDGMSVKGATVTVTVQATGSEYCGYTNDDGNYSIGFTAPGEIGWQDVTVEITDYTLTGQVEDQFEVISCEGEALDLAISISVSGLPAIVGSTMTVDGSIHNVGAQPATPLVVYLLKDGAICDTFHLSIDTLNPGQMKFLPPIDISFDSFGNHCLSGWIVPVADEVYQGNNFSTNCFKVWPNCIDLVPTDISFSDQTPLTDSTITITGRVENRGGEPVEQPFVCKFWANEIYIDSVIVDSLMGCGAVAYVEVSYAFPQETTYTVLLEVDPQNHISECDTSNNTYHEDIFAHAPKPDFQVEYYDLTTSSTYPDSGDSIYLQAYVYNQGEITGDSVWVRFFLDSSPLGDDVKIQVKVDSSFLVQSTEQWEVNFEPHLMKVFVDPESLVAELSKNNNLAICPLPADLKPLPSSQTPRKVYVNEEVTLQGTIENVGGFDVLDTVQVGFYDTLIVDETTRTWVSTTLVPVDSMLNHKGQVEAETSYAFTSPGLHQLTIFADALDEIPEYSEENNSFNFYVTVLESLPDLMIRSEDIAPTDINPDSGELVYANITVHNIGVKPATDIGVKVMIDTDSLDFRLIDSIPKAADPDSYRTIDSVGPWVATDSLTHTHVFWVIVDPDSLIAELSEDNNEATRTIIVNGYPDLFPDSLFPFDRGSGQTIAKAQIRNKGGGDASFAQVGFFYTDGGSTSCVGYDTVYVAAGGADTASIVWGEVDTVGVACVVITNCVPFDYHPENDSICWGIPLGVGEEEPCPPLPQSFSLFQNYPNPFNPVTRIKYALPKDCNVKLTIYNILGRKAVTLVNESQAAGYKIVHWDSRSQSRNEVASGIYFYRLKAGDFVETRKMILLR